MGMGKALYRVYNEMEIRCSYYEKCKRTVKIYDMEGHENNCAKEKCCNYEACGEEVAPAKRFRGKYCTPECYLSELIMKETDMNILYALLKETYKVACSLVNELTWDTKYSSPSLLICRSTAQIPGSTTLNFCTAITEQAFISGMHYWEIKMDVDSLNELKAGVTTNKAFDKNKAFSDFHHGFAYYGIGQLRSGSDCNGDQYGRRWGKEEALGILLDMNKGTLSFSIGGKSYGVAFRSESLKTGPIYPAVAILNHGGFSIQARPIPAIFENL